jgi:hypothetical protein
MMTSRVNRRRRCHRRRVVVGGLPAFGPAFGPAHADLCRWTRASRPLRRDEPVLDGAAFGI